MRIGPYEVVSTLGQGGMGVVYAARSPEGHEVAVKVLHQKAGDDLARFERERRLLASLGEPDGFVPLLDAGTTAAGPYLVMPLLTGGTLRKRLEAGPLGIEETVGLGRSLAAALGAAHARGVVHRDLKPENILFTAAGLPLVADLGLAKHFDPGAPGASQSVSLSVDGALRGTAGYMAPEQMADARSVAGPADVFALGVILYECLAGEPPFLGDGLVEVLATVAAGRFEPLRSRHPEVPAWLASVIERALSHAAWDRFPDGLALGRALAAGDVSESRGSHVVPVAAVAIVAVAGLAALGLRGGSGPRQPVAPRVVAPPPKRVVSEDARARAEAARKRSDERFAAGDLDGAIADVEQAMALDPGHALDWGNRGRARGNKGDYQGAVADFTRAIELDPKYTKAWCNRANARGNGGDLDGAIADYDQALALDPRYGLAWSNRGLTHCNMGAWEAAIADFDRVIDLDPAYAPVWMTRALAREKTGDTAGAIADYGHFLEIAPGDPQAPKARAEVERLTALRDRR
jgi:tetratricopeptide (TPR) repeat protein